MPGLEPVILVIRKGGLRWVRHDERKDDSGQTLCMIRYGGRRRKMWDGVKEEIKSSGLSETMYRFRKTRGRGGNWLAQVCLQNGPQMGCVACMLYNHWCVCVFCQS